MCALLGDGCQALPLWLHTESNLGPGPAASFLLDGHFIVFLVPLLTGPTGSFLPNPPPRRQMRRFAAAADPKVSAASSEQFGPLLIQAFAH